MVWWIVGIVVVWLLIAVVIALRVGRGLGSLRQKDDEDEG